MTDLGPDLAAGLRARPADWRCSLLIPDGWITVDLDSGERSPAAAAAVDAAVRDTPELSGVAEAMRQTVAAATQVAVDRGALFLALGFEPVGIDVVAMSVTVYGLTTSGGAVGLDVLADELAVPQPEDFNGRDVRMVELPVGPAVRLHTMTTGAADPTDGDGGGDGRSLFVEAVDHFVPVAGTADVALISCSTPSVAVGDQALALFDRIAASVDIVTGQPGGPGEPGEPEQRERPGEG
jgi:hypothetical protein